jgi:hypothetical protein
MAVMGVLTCPAVTTKKGPQVEKADVHVFDHTSEAALTLWGYNIGAAGVWKPSHTVLLLTRARLATQRRATLGIGDGTWIDVDPAMRDAHWLREYAHGLKKREHVNPPFPTEGMRAAPPPSPPRQTDPAQSSTWKPRARLKHAPSSRSPLSTTCTAPAPQRPPTH